MIRLAASRRKLAEVLVEGHTDATIMHCRLKHVIIADARRDKANPTHIVTGFPQRFNEHSRNIFVQQ